MGLQFTITFDALEEAAATLARRSARFYRVINVAGQEAVEAFKEELVANSPVDTGLLASSYRTHHDFAGQATISNDVDYWEFNLYGTGQRGAASGVPGSLFTIDPGYSYGDSPGMAAYEPLWRTMASAPQFIDQFVTSHVHGSLF